MRWTISLSWNDRADLHYEVVNHLPVLALADALNFAEKDMPSLRDGSGLISPPDAVRMERSYGIWGE